MLIQDLTLDELYIFATLYERNFATFRLNKKYTPEEAVLSRVRFEWFNGKIFPLTILDSLVNKGLLKVLQENDNFTIYSLSPPAPEQNVLFFKELDIQIALGSIC